MLGIIFLVPETSYVRPQTKVHPLSFDDEESKVELELKEKGNSQHIETVPIPEHVTGNGRSESGETEPKMSYWRSLRVFTGRYTDAPTWKIFLRPLVMFFYPAVFWAFLIYGTTLTWVSFIIAVLVSSGDLADSGNR